MIGRHQDLRQELSLEQIQVEKFHQVWYISTNTCQTEKKQNKLWLSCAKLSSRWCQLNQLSLVATLSTMLVCFLDIYGSLPSSQLCQPTPQPALLAREASFDSLLTSKLSQPTSCVGKFSSSSTLFPALLADSIIRSDSLLHSHLQQPTPSQLEAGMRLAIYPSIY